MTPVVDSQAASKAWFRHLTTGYLFALGLIALLAVVGQILIQHTISAHASDSHVVDLAGRQRMLSQRLVNLVLLLGKATDGPQRLRLLNDLRQDLEVWDTTHQGLQKGDSTLGLPGHNSASIQELFAELEPHKAGIQGDVSEVLAAYEKPGSDPQFQAELERPVQSMLTRENSFVAGMNKIVQQFATEADARGKTVRSIAAIVFVITLVVLVLTGLLIFRPLAQRFHGLLLTNERARAELEGGHQISAKHANENFQRIARKLGMPVGREAGFTLHALRRFFETFCVNSRVPQRAVDVWMGHRSDKSMGAIYYSLSDAESQAMMAEVPFILGPPASGGGHS